MFSNRVLVPVGDDTAKKEDTPATPTEALKPPSRRKFLSLWLAIFGMLSLSYLLGAAVMFFQFPSSDFLGKAFMGARAWNERRQLTSTSSDQNLPAVTMGNVDKPGKTFDGFTLYTCGYVPTAGTEAFLINMRREVVHTWAVPFSKVWPDPRHLPGPVDDSLVCFFDCHLYADGDLLVVFHGLQHFTNGYGLAKLDKESKVVWCYPANIHHDVDVGEDGTIYAIKQKLVYEMPEGLEFIRTPCLVDSLVMLSPEGRELQKPISILEAFRDSPYATFLSVLDRPGHPQVLGLTMSRTEENFRRMDALHTNCVRVLTRQLAPKFPLFKAGQVVISMRSLDTIAVLDTEKGRVVWAARGPWRSQHDPQFLENGHLLIFDNDGLPGRSRVLEYDPQTQAFPWSYAGENAAPFYTYERGMSQRLPNGNTLIVNSESHELFEVTRSKEVVWSCSTDRFITSGRRYSPEQLHFLKGGQRARP